LREILDSGRCPAKGRIAAASSQGQVADVDPLVLVPGADWAYAIAVGVAAVIACGPGMKEDFGEGQLGFVGVETRRTTRPAAWTGVAARVRRVPGEPLTIASLNTRGIP